MTIPEARETPMSDADYLRETAALIRETAQAATPGPWSVTFIPESAVANQHIIDRWFAMGCFDGNPRNPTGPASMSEYEPDARHIASWSPPVALAVADWLDTAGADLWSHGPLCACGSGCHDCDDSLWQPHARRALAVARAWRGDA